jgi:hypothetical protein
MRDERRETKDVLMVHLLASLTRTPCNQAGMEA